MYICIYHLLNVIGLFLLCITLNCLALHIILSLIFTLSLAFHKCYMDHVCVNNKK